MRVKTRTRARLKVNGSKSSRARVYQPPQKLSMSQPLAGTDGLTYLPTSSSDAKNAYLIDPVTSQRHPSLMPTTPMSSPHIDNSPFIRPPQTPPSQSRSSTPPSQSPHPTPPSNSSPYSPTQRPAPPFPPTDSPLTTHRFCAPGPKV